MGIDEFLKQSIRILHVSESVVFSHVEMNGEGNFGQFIEGRCLLPIHNKILFLSIIELFEFLLLGELLEVQQVLGA